MKTNVFCSRKRTHLIEKRIDGWFCSDCDTYVFVEFKEKVNISVGTLLDNAEILTQQSL